jgi:O-acetylhomoserine (thiol)-lyase
MSDEDLLAAGIGPEMIRLSIGIENLDDILWDLDQALHASQQDHVAAERNGAGHSVLSKAFGAPYQG